VDENVIVGIEGFEDAGVYKVTDEIALVQTVDSSLLSWMTHTGSGR
jgi:selenophosphate synthase